MRKAHAYLTVAALALGSLALMGCETGTAVSSEETDVQLLGQAPQESLSAPDITLDMKRFDAGIGDTATGVGGGGDAD